MDLDIIARLVQILKDAPELGAIEVRRGLFGAWSSIRVTKAGRASNAGGPHFATGPLPGGTLYPFPVAPGATGEGAAAPGAPASAGAPPPAVPSNLVEIKSPMVGTFYAAPEPGAESYVKVGSRVSSGQVVCIIEAMKIMNEIESEYAGVVKEILAQDAQPVEYGQVLYKIDPNG